MPTSLSRRFQVLQPFAHGHSGSLYIADEPETGRRGLLKILAPSPKDQQAERQRLRRELVKQATLTRAHLVVPLASGESEGVTWLFREWLDGVALEVRLSREGALQQTEALAIAAQIASALDELHRGGLLHRDVKPGHIFLQPTPHGIPRALLLDAGVATAFTTEAGGAVYGTPGYVAPEQLVGKLVSFRSDLYSLGCVLYRMLTGRPAFAGESVEQTLTAQRHGELPAAPADLPNGIGALLQSILAKDPQQRPFSAQKLRRTLDPFLPDGALMEKQPTTTFETVPQPSPSIAPPSGTLKPPPPPSMRPSLPAPADADPVLKPRISSAPPPAPPSRKRPREENTQQIDITQLEELAPMQRRTASVPPPTPGSAKATLPPPPKPPNDNTQPIRLDQILAVENARRAAINRPPQPQDADATGVFTPKHVAPLASATAEPEADNSSELEAALRTMAEDSVAPEPPAQVPALFGAQDEPFDAPLPATSPSGHELPAPLFQAPVEAVSPVAATVPQMPAVTVPAARPVPSAADSQTSTSTNFRKATLLGMGSASLDLSLPFDAPSLDSAPEDAGREQASAREPDDSSERLPQILAELDDESDDEAAAAASSMPAGTLSASRGQRRDSRRLLMYGSAALVGLAILAVGTSALRSGPSTVASGEATQAPAAATSAAATPTTVESAQAPRPVVHAPTPSTDQLAPPAAPKSDEVPAAAPTNEVTADKATPSTQGATGGAASDNTAAPATSATSPGPAATAGATAATASAVPARADAPASGATVTSAATTAGATVAPSAAAAPAAKTKATAALVVPPTPVVAKASHTEPAEPKLTAREPHESASGNKHAASDSAHAAPRASARDKEPANSAKTSPAEKKGTDKAALFAAARDEARSAYAAKRYKDAAAAYERAAKYDPKHAGTFAGLGAARLQQGDHAGAVEAYQRAVQLSPDSSGFQAALGRAYLSAGDKAKAIAAYKRALALDPNNEAAKLALKQLHG